MLDPGSHLGVGSSSLEFARSVELPSILLDDYTFLGETVSTYTEAVATTFVTAMDQLQTKHEPVIEGLCPGTSCGWGDIPIIVAYRMGLYQPWDHLPRKELIDELYEESAHDLSEKYRAIVAGIEETIYSPFNAAYDQAYATYCHYRVGSTTRAWTESGMRVVAGGCWRHVGWHLGAPGLIMTPIFNNVRTIERYSFGVWLAMVILNIGIFTSAYLAHPKLRGAAWKAYEEFGRLGVHQWIYNNSEPLEPNFRPQSKDFELVEHHSAKANHSHPVAGGTRDMGLGSIDAFLTSKGKTAYTLSGSGARDPDPGMHGMFMLKDFTISPRTKPVKPTDVVVGMDDDYYHDMPSILTWGKPCVLYTFAPRAVAGSLPDGTYTVHPDNTVEVNVTGGAKYRHEIWNWQQDSVAAFSWIECAYYIYDVEYRRVDALNNFNRDADTGAAETIKTEWQYVFLTPVRKINGLAALVAYFTYPSEWLLRRRKFEVHGDFLVSHFSEVNPKTSRKVGKVSLRRHNHPFYRTAAITINMDTLASLLAKAELEKVKASYQILGYLNETDVKHWSGEEKIMASTFLAEYLRKMVPGDLPEIQEDTRVIGKKSPGYIITAGYAHEDNHAPWKLNARRIHKPILNVGSTHPAKHPNNATASVVGRITSVLNREVPPSIFNTYAKEFIRFCCLGREYTIQPLEISDVMERQQTAAQIQRNSEMAPWLTYTPPEPKPKSFVKKEATNDFNDPRNITTERTDFGLRLGTVTYAVKEQVLKQLPWYSPGKEYSQIAGRLVRMAMCHRYVTEAYGSRFDGRVSRWLLRYVQNAFYLTIVDPDVSKWLEPMLAKEMDCVAKTENRAEYLTGYSRLSGSPLTTDGNTLISGFLDYAAGRESGLSPNDSWQTLGVACGDDMANVRPGKILADTSAKLGMKHECIEHRGSTLVGFLGRKFPGPFTGSVASIQDQERQWAKIGDTYAPEHIPIEQAMKDKALGYQVLDPGNPLTVAYAKMLIRVSNSMGGKDLVPRITKWDTPYWVWLQWEEHLAKHGDPNLRQYLDTNGLLDFSKFEFAGWPQPEDEEVANQLVMEALRIGPEQYYDILGKFAATNTLEELEQLTATPLITNRKPPPPKNEYVVILPPRRDDDHKHGVASEWFKPSAVL